MSTFREKRGWTLIDLGKRTGMSSDWLGLLERGLNVPSLNTILKIAEAFDVPASTLIDLVERLRKDGTYGRIMYSSES